MPKIYAESPFFDDYETAKNKGYNQVIFKPGRVAQAREVTQMQSMLYDHIGRVGSSLFKEGAVVSGCDVIINDKTVKITSGRIFLDTLVREVSEHTFTIKGVGREIIGAQLVTTLVSEVEDPSLRDPAEGMLNSGNPGAYRRKEVVKLVLDGTDVVPMYVIQEGSLLVEKKESTTDLMASVLARRTYDENGNFKIDGLELADRKEVRDNKVIVSLSSGKAYVEGYEVLKGYSTIVSIDLATDYRLVVNEPKVYKGTVTRYKLNNSPVKEFVKVVAEVKHTQSLTRGSISGGMDFLDKSPVTAIDRITQGGTIYQQGVDYQLTNDSVDWSLSGNEPVVGSTYQIIYRYNKSLVPGVDIQLVSEDSIDWIEFFTLGDKPIENTTFMIDYNFYLARKDLVLLDKNGEVIISKGKSDIVRLTETPLSYDSTKLIIGTVLVLPKSNDIVISNYNTTRLDQAQIYNMLRRIMDLEYNQAISDLDKEAIEGAQATNLKGVFTDGFIGLTKSDLGNRDYSCTIDVDRGELTLPIQQNVYELTPNWNSLETNVGRFGRVVTAPYTEEVILTQSQATESMLINPYSVFKPMVPIVLDPEVDTWVDTTKVVVNKEQTSTLTLRRWWYHRGESWAETEKQKWQKLGYADGGESLGWQNPTSKLSTKSNTEVVLEDAVFYMRPREVNISASNFNPNQDNIVLYFNDTKIPIIPLSGYSSGTEAGTIRSDSKGEIKGKFTVPVNIPCGTVSVKLKSGTFEGVTSYRAEGRKQVVEDTVITTKTVTTPVDPLAQSFSIPEDRFVTSLGLYFKEKDPLKAVVLQVRNTVNGYPGTVVYAEEIIKSDSINVSDDARAVTKVKLTNPVYCKANEVYSVCILSDSDKYKMWVATLGQRDVTTQEFVLSQAYTTGVLFSSSNGTTWTAHQTSDLKLDVYSTKFNGDGQIVFDDVTPVTLSRILLATQSVDYKNNGLTWYYKVGDGQWLPIESYVERDLGIIANKISLKLNIKSSSISSPIILSEVISIVGFIDKTSGTYISRTVEMTEFFNKLRVMFEVALPSSTSIKVFYKTEDVSDTWVELTSPTIVKVDEEFSRYSYDKTITQAKKYKVKIEMTTSNPLSKPRVRKLMSILKY